MASRPNKCIHTLQACRSLFAQRCDLRLAIFSIVVGITFMCRAEDDPEREMAKIATAHKHWRESIVSVRFVWETVHDPHSQVAKEAGSEGVKKTASDEFIWCDDGRFRLHHSVRRNDGPEILRTLKCGNSKRSYSMNYGNGPSELEKPESVYVFPPPTPGRGGGLTLVPLEGLWFSHRLHWFADLIAQGLVNFDGYEDIKGERLPRVKVEFVPGIFVPVPLSPQNGYLPRQIGSGVAQDEVHSYREVEPNLWFPWTGSHAGANSQTWEMKEIQVNGHLDPRLFEPVFAPGTIIDDVVSGKRTVHGVASHSSEVEQRIAQAATNNLALAGEPIKAIPPTSGVIRWVMFGSLVSLGLVVVAVLVRRRV